MFPKFENIKMDGRYIDDDKNIQKLPRMKLLGFLLFHIQGGVVQVLHTPREMLMKELFLIKF